MENLLELVFKAYKTIITFRTEDIDEYPIFVYMVDFLDCHSRQLLALIKVSLCSI